MSKLDFNDPVTILTDKIIGAAIEVHKYLGPGLLESAYETCLAYERWKKLQTFTKRRYCRISNFQDAKRGY